jgi:erythromycin esterase
MATLKRGVSGTVLYEDGIPAAGASITFTSLTSGVQVNVATADHNGKFPMPTIAGDYALAVAAERGTAWVARQPISDSDIIIKLTNKCQTITGHVANARTSDTYVTFNRHSSDTGDAFIASVRSDGHFSICLLPGKYTAFLTGEMLSSGIEISVPAKTDVQLQGYKTSEVKSAPKISENIPIPHDIDSLVADIQHSGATLIGMGEATHGSAEFVRERAQLMFELASRAQLQLVLLEIDAISAFALERYVMGESIDASKAVSGLGYWTSDTYEFLHFIEEVRAYNAANATARIHIWGIDVQDTKAPVALLVANAQRLQLSQDEQILLKSIANDRAEIVRQFPVPRRAALDTLLLRLTTAGSSAELDTQLSIAARSLLIQVGYMDDDTQGLYSERRDAGMAQLASFIVERTGVKRACLWAHDDHISRFSPGSPSMGQRLSAAFSSRYYPIGFFFFEGSSRAWDAANAIGVISHTLKRAPSFTMEGVVMSATNAPEVAWLALNRAPADLRTWLETPRFVRELGAVYNGEERALILLNLRSAFDALVVIRTVHDSSPTPTGIRRAKR